MKWKKTTHRACCHQTSFMEPSGYQTAPSDGVTRAYFLEISKTSPQDIGLSPDSVTLMMMAESGLQRRKHLLMFKKQCVYEQILVRWVFRKVSFWAVHSLEVLAKRQKQTLKSLTYRLLTHLEVPTFQASAMILLTTRSTGTRSAR